MRFNRVSCVSLAIGSLVACSGAGPGGERVGSSSAGICSAPTFGSNAAGNYAPPGTQVTWTATSTCGNGETAEYQFWMEAPGQSYAIVQDWGTSGTFNWDTTSATAGNYNFQVWIKANDSVAEYDTFDGAPFTLGSVTACTSVSTTVDPAGPSPGGAEGQTTIGKGNVVAITSSASCGASTPEYEVWSLAPGASSWVAVQSYGTASEYDWDTTGATPGTYFFQVWALAEGLPNAYDTYTSFAYQLDTACSAAGLSATPATSTIVGNPVSVNATSTCGGTANYQFWELPPGGSWTMAQDWSSASTYSWDTTGAAAGSYSFQVWVENQGEETGYEAWSQTTYTLTTGAACTDGALATSVASPQPVGTALTLTASASSCPSAQYQFWASLPGGSWTMVQDWSSTATYVPDTTSAGPGTYEYQVWIRQTGSTATYDTWSEVVYVLTPPVDGGASDAGGSDAGSSDADGSDAGGAG